MRRTIRDIANLTGLSIATVSRALQDVPSVHVSEATRARVLAAARDLAYQPNSAARALVTGRTDAIGIWLEEGFSDYYSLVSRHASRAASRAGLHAFFYSLEEESRHRAEPATAGQRVDGAVFFDVGKERLEYFELFRSAHLPVVAAGMHQVLGFDLVHIDYQTAATLALDHLVQQGAERIAYLDRAPRGDLRHLAFLDHADRRGQEPLLLRLEERSRAGARRAVSEAARAGRLPDALLCANDELAVGALCGLLDAGVRVPEDVMLVGCDGLEETAYHRPAVSTLATPVERMCEMAIRALQERIADPTLPPRRWELVPELVVRDSSLRRRLP